MKMLFAQKEHNHAQEKHSWVICCAKTVKSQLNVEVFFDLMFLHLLEFLRPSSLCRSVMFSHLLARSYISHVLHFTLQCSNFPYSSIEVTEDMAWRIDYSKSIYIRNLLVADGYLQWIEVSSAHIIWYILNCFGYSTYSHMHIIHNVA